MHLISSWECHFLLNYIHLCGTFVVVHLVIGRITMHVPQIYHFKSNACLRFEWYQESADPLLQHLSHRLTKKKSCQSLTNWIQADYGRVQNVNFMQPVATWLDKLHAVKNRHLHVNGYSASKSPERWWNTTWYCHEVKKMHGHVHCIFSCNSAFSTIKEVIANSYR